MAEFKVWAPVRQKMSVVVEGKPTAMERLGGGWWIADVSSPADCDYMFELDNEQLLPDPRSRYQPDGIHGVSRLVEPTGFKWTDSGFQQPPLSSAILYELHIGTFTPNGTFDSAIERLGHLKQLGITHVELMPVAEFAGVRRWGYDGTFPYAAHHAYGGPAGLQRLVNACHAEGLAVILDVVYNHLGPSGNYLPQFGPYFSDRHKTPWGSAVNFDGPGSHEVRQYFLDNAKMWLRDFHFDGLRLYAIHAIVDTSAYPFLEQLVVEVETLEAQLGRHLVVIAESDFNDPRVVRSREVGGFGLSGQWNDDFHHAIHVALTGEKHGYYRDFGGLTDLATVFEQPFLFGGRFSGFRERLHGRSANGLEPEKFVAYSQNHDQVGNRATGERLHQLIGPDRAKIAAAITLLSPYVPLLFQGEEWAASSPFQYFVDFADDPALAQAVSEGRRNEFRAFHDRMDVPDPQDERTFLRSKIDWAELDSRPHHEMLAWYRELIAMRRQVASLIAGAANPVRTRLSEQDEWLLVERGPVFMAVNFASADRAIELPGQLSNEILLGSKAGATIVGKTICLPDNTFVLFKEAPRLAAAAEPTASRARSSTISAGY